MNTLIAVTRPIDFADELAAFRSARSELVSSDLSPLALDQGPKVVLHLVPKTAFNKSTFVNLESRDSSLMPLFAGGGYNDRPNFDGRVSFSGGSEGVQSYVQLFHTGVIEAVYVFAERYGKTLDAKALRSCLIKATASYLKEQKRLDVKLPVVVMLTCLGMKGSLLAIGNDYDQYPIDRDTLPIPEITVDTFEPDVSKEMKPIFDRLWNAAGAPRCFEDDI
jgi:hypothetical protein